MHVNAGLSILSLMAVKNEGRRAGCKLLLMAKVKVQSGRCALAGGGAGSPHGENFLRIFFQRRPEEEDRSEEQLQ